MDIALAGIKSRSYCQISQLCKPTAHILDPFVDPEYFVNDQDYRKLLSFLVRHRPVCRNVTIGDPYRHFTFDQTNVIGCDLCLRRDRLNSGGKSTRRKNRSDKKLASIKNWRLWNGIDDVLAHRSPCVLGTYDFYFSNRRGQE